MRRNTWSLVLVLLGLVVHGALAAEMPPFEGRTNLAAGCKVVFSPVPNYALTQKGESDATDLTDGKFSQRADRHIWFESAAVGWSYGGRVLLAFDLGHSARIDEIAIRLLGGSFHAGGSIPGWVEAFTSDDGEHFRKVAEFSRWKPDDFARFGVPDDAGKAWIHCLRFTNLAVHGRWIGLRMYSSATTASDELFVFGAIDDSAKPVASGTPSDFTVTHPLPHFHKPELVIATDLALPVPVGITVPTAMSKDTRAVRLNLELPKGVEVVGGNFGGQKIRREDATELPQGNGLHYTLSAQLGKDGKSQKDFGRLYFKAPGWSDGQKGTLRYTVEHGNWKSPAIELPLVAVAVPPAPRMKRIMAGLGWCSAGITAGWPDAFEAWRQIGLNSFSLFAQMMKDDESLWNLVEQARKQGFFVVNIDSPPHRMQERHRRDKEIYCQFADGTVGAKLCPSYRGPSYQDGVRRFAAGMGRACPGFVALDIETWGWRGPTDSQKCIRCQKDFAASGLKDWQTWWVAKGNEMWKDMIGAAHAEVARHGGKPFEVGGYDFRPDAAYQGVWSVAQLYPEWMQDSQVSTYTNLYPYHLALIGDEVRLDRTRLAHSDVLPWITPGNAGTFPGEAFQWALLECYANGARGVYFWSAATWDSEDLIAYNRVVRAIAPVEDLILEGELVGDAATVAAPARLSGIRRDGAMLLLVADYFRRTNRAVQLGLSLSARSQVRDLLTGETLATDLPAGTQTLTVPLGSARGRLLHVRPN